MESIEPVAPLDVEFDWHPVKQAYFEGFNDGATRLPTDDGSFQWENSNAISHTRAEPSLDAAPVAYFFRFHTDDSLAGKPNVRTFQLCEGAPPKKLATEGEIVPLYTAPQAASALREALRELVEAHTELQARSWPGGAAQYEQQRDRLRAAWGNARKVLEG